MMGFSEPENKEKINLKPNVGLITGCSLIIGGIIGQFIFTIIYGNYSDISPYKGFLSSAKIIDCGT